MKTTKQYSKPQAEVIDLQPCGTLLIASPYEEDATGKAWSPRRNRHRYDDDDDETDE